MDHSKRTLCVPKWELQITAVKRVCILKIKILIGAVRLQSVGLCPHRTRSKARSGAIRCRRVKRCAEDHDMAVLIRPVTSEKRFNVAVPHLRVSPLHSSAGQMQLRAAVCYSSVSLCRATSNVQSPRHPQGSDSLMRIRRANVPMDRLVYVLGRHG